MRKLAALVLGAASIAGCSLERTETSEPLTRLVVSQQGEASIVVIDLYNDPEVRTYPVPFASPVETADIIRLELHPWGGVAFVIHGAEMQRINLESGDALPDTGEADDWPEDFDFMSNGLYVVGKRHGSSSEIYARGLLADVSSSLTRWGHTIIDIDVCDDDETVLVVTYDHPFSYLSAYRIDASGTLSDPGHELRFEEGRSVQQVECAAGSGAGAVSVADANDLISFTIDRASGLEQVDVQAAVVSGTDLGAAPSLSAIVFNPDGTALYARVHDDDAVQGWIEKFNFDPATAEIIPAAGWLASSVPLPESTYPSSRMTMDPEGDVIYVPDPDNPAIRVFSTRDGARLDSITDALMTDFKYIDAGQVTCFDPEGYGCD